TRPTSATDPQRSSRCRYLPVSHQPAFACWPLAPPPKARLGAHQARNEPEKSRKWQRLAGVPAHSEASSSSQNSPDNKCCRRRLQRIQRRASQHDARGNPEEHNPDAAELFAVDFSDVRLLFHHAEHLWLIHSLMCSRCCQS